MAMWQRGIGLIRYKNNFLLEQFTLKSQVQTSRCKSSLNLERVLEKCVSIVGSKNASTSPSTLEQHSHDESYHRNNMPNVVVWPETVQQVSELMKFSSTEKIPVIPYSTGTGLEGGVTAVDGGVCINLTHMDKISNLHVEDFDVTVEPGVTRLTLNQYLRDTGLWFPVDPGADASLCGMAATSASGTNAVRYGTMKENIINLQVVLPDGTILHTAGEKRRFRKSAAGYNLTSLFVGSEGTLGLITSATVRLHPVPECTLSGVCSFPNVEDAVNCTTNIIQAGIPVARIEFLDKNMMDASNRYSDLSYPVSPTIFFEFHGSDNGTQEQINLAGEIVSMNNGSNFEWAKEQEDRNKLWKARHEALYAIIALNPGGKAYSTDVCVPVSCLPEAVTHAEDLLSSLDAAYGIVGHVGDGNFHCVINFDPSDEREREQVIEAADKIAMKALSLGGTCTGEHGVGLGKKHLLLKEVGQEGINLMKSIKSAIDPLHIMNPGKIF